MQGQGEEKKEGGAGRGQDGNRFCSRSHIERKLRILLQTRTCLQAENKVGLEVGRQDTICIYSLSVSCNFYIFDTSDESLLVLAGPNQPLSKTGK